MELNLEILAYTVLGVGVAIELLKRNKLDTNILALVATVLGALLFISQTGLSIQNAIIGAVIGAASSGFYDLGKGLASVTEIGKKLTNKDKTTGEE